MYINEEEIVNHISAKPFHLISEAAEELGEGREDRNKESKRQHVLFSSEV